MALYRLFLFRHGELAGKVDRHSAEDSDILETAQALCRRAYTVEIYQESRFVARIEQRD